jgi:hypothetical protein
MKREREREVGVVRDTTVVGGDGQELFIFGFEGSQAVSALPPDRGKAFD